MPPTAKKAKKYRKYRRKISEIQDYTGKIQAKYRKIKENKLRLNGPPKFEKEKKKKVRERNN